MIVLEYDFPAGWWSLRWRIPVADDDPSVLRIVAAMLGRWNYDVIPAGDGLEAWDILQQQDIRFVISDWMIPGLAGPELCRRVRAAGFAHRLSKNQVFDLFDSGFGFQPIFGRSSRLKAGATENFFKNQ